MSYREIKSDASGALTLLVGGAVTLLLTWLGMHGNAKLSAKERQELIDGLKRTFANSKSSGSSG